jgi:hypothetical protein
MSMVTPPYPADPLVPLGESGFSKTVILNNIYGLVNGVVNALQSATVAQANRITLFTTWQSAYTNELAQIPIFTKTTGLPPGQSYTSSQMTTLTNLVGRYTSQVQNRQSVIANASKTLQSNVDQSNNAVNAQSTLATTLIQQFSTLLASAFSH